MPQQESAEEAIITIGINDSDRAELERSGQCEVNWPAWKGEPPRECILETLAQDFSKKGYFLKKRGKDSVLYEIAEE